MKKLSANLFSRLFFRPPNVIPLWLLLASSSMFDCVCTALHDYQGRSARSRPSGERKRISSEVAERELELIAFTNLLLRRCSWEVLDLIRLDTWKVKRSRKWQVYATKLSFVLFCLVDDELMSKECCSRSRLRTRNSCWTAFASRSSRTIHWGDLADNFVSEKHQRRKKPQTHHQHHRRKLLLVS